ncbi:MAG: energy transducer TonB [Crocinitomicaceae bacterium]|nr:energy transducer TonB [Crocinitomicaceae bacterium]
MTRTRFILYLIIVLIVLIFAITEIAINLNDKPQDKPIPEMAEDDSYYGDQQTEPATETEPEEPFTDESDVSDFAEVDPAFPGGESAMIKFIQENVTYPELSREMGEQGTVYVQFVVHTDGSIQNVKVLKGVSELLDREAVRVIKKMPNWSPGKQDGEPVRVRYQIPINFRIA